MCRVGLFVACALVALSADAWSADGYSVSNAATEQITEHGVCRKVTNAIAGGAGLYVPTKYDSEWSVGSKAFINNTVSGVTLDACLEAMSFRMRGGTNYLSYTPPANANGRLWTFSAWMKIGVPSGASPYVFSDGVTTNSNYKSGVRYVTSNGRLRISIGNQVVNASSTETSEGMVDTTSWYHIVLRADTAQAAADDRLEGYINGANNMMSGGPAINTGTGFTTAFPWRIGDEMDGNIADVHFIDGQALPPTEFGQADPVTGQWVPKAYSGTYGTTGFRLKFDDVANIGKDSSGLGNDWTPVNVGLVSSTNTYDPSNDYPGAGTNYATFSTTDRTYWPRLTISSASTVATQSGATARGAWGTIAMPRNTGKWFMEFQANFATITGAAVGLADQETGVMGRYIASGVTAGLAGSPSFATFANGDVIGVAYDSDAGSVAFYKNGTLQGGGSYVITGIASGTVVPFVSTETTTGNGYWFANFGQKPFRAVPVGYDAVTTAKAWPGTYGRLGDYYVRMTSSGTSRTVALGLGVDALWIRNSTGIKPIYLYDLTRGLPNHLMLGGVSGTLAEGTSPNGVYSISGTGFSVGNNGDMTAATVWAWKKGPTFDVVTYNGTGANQTIAHNLGSVPAMIWVKRRNAGSTNWFAWMKGMPGTDYFGMLNSTAAVTNASNPWGTGAKTSTGFSVGGLASTSGGTYVAYVFGEAEGSAKFGKYIGNGNSDGAFINTGMRPRLTMIKSMGTGDWYIGDADFSTSSYLLATAGTVSGTAGWNYYSNGAKIAATNAAVNASGTTYLYAAFGDPISKYGNGQIE